MEVHHPSGDIVTYAYNGDGLRVWQDDGVDEVRYVHDGNNVLLETDGLGTVEAEFTYIPQAYAQVISQLRSGDSSFYQFDGTSNVRQLTDSSQVVTDDYSFDAWGTLVSSTGSTANSQLWKGQYLAYRKDPDAGPEVQYAMHHRNYNPKTGVFTSADPAKDDLNLYRYVKNNPVNRTDPSGLEEKKRRSRSAQIYEAYEAGNGPSNQSDSSHDEQRRNRAQLKADVEKAAIPIEPAVAATEAFSESVKENGPKIIDAIVRPPKPINAISEFVENSVDFSTSPQRDGNDSTQSDNDWAYLIAKIRLLAGGLGRTTLPDVVLPEPTSGDIKRAARDLKAAQELGEAGVEKIATEVSDGWMGLRALEDANDNMTLPPLDSDGTYFEQVGDKFEGMGDSLKNTVEGGVNIVLSPVESAKGLADAASHPGTTLRRVAEDAREKSTSSRGQGELVGDAIQAAAGTEASGKVLGKLGKWYRGLKQSIKGKMKGGETPTLSPVPTRAARPEPAANVEPSSRAPVGFQHPDLEDATNTRGNAELEKVREFNDSPPKAEVPWKVRFNKPRAMHFDVGGRKFATATDVIEAGIRDSGKRRPRLIDAGIQDVVEAIEKEFPGMVEDIELIVERSNGIDATDLDIVTKKAIIQVTGGRSKLGSSMTRAAKAIEGTPLAGRPVIGILEEGVESRLLKRPQIDGRFVTNDFNELIQFLRGQ